MTPLKSSRRCAAQGGRQRTHNQHYRQYNERYQYVKRFSSERQGSPVMRLSSVAEQCRCRRIEVGMITGVQARETLLRNQSVLQQGCAC